VGAAGLRAVALMATDRMVTDLTATDRTTTDFTASEANAIEHCQAQWQGQDQQPCQQQGAMASQPLQRSLGVKIQACLSTTAAHQSFLLLVQQACAAVGAAHGIGGNSFDTGDLHALFTVQVGLNRKSDRHSTLRPAAPG